MGLFRRDPPAAQPPLPIPRVSRVWPKAQPKAALDDGTPPAAPASAAAPAVEAPRLSVRDAASVGAAFASWKQATAARTASATAVADASSQVALRAEPAPPPIAVKPAAPLLPTPAPSLLKPEARSPEPVRHEEPTPLPIAARREDPVMFVYRAAAKQARGEHEAAIADLSRAIDLDPACTVAWAGRAISLEATGDLAGAKRDYAKSIEIELRQEIARHARPL